MDKKGFSVDEEVVVVVGKDQIRGLVTEVKIHTGICEVLVNGIIHYFFLETGRSIESDEVWIEPILVSPDRIGERASRAMVDSEIITAFRAARKAAIRDDQKQIIQIARGLCVCDLSCQLTVAKSLDICLRAKLLQGILQKFAIGEDAEPSADMIAAIRDHLQ